MKFKKGDKVLITAGKDRGKTGEVTKSLPKAGKIVVSGLNVMKKYVKPSSKNPSGGIVEFFSPIATSNTMIICSHCGKATRISYLVKDKNKVRVCKKCKETL